jgi:hypothetical protein
VLLGLLREGEGIGPCPSARASAWASVTTSRASRLKRSNISDASGPAARARRRAPFLLRLPISE